MVYDLQIQIILVMEFLGTCCFDYFNIYFIDENLIFILVISVFMMAIYTFLAK